MYQYAARVVSVPAGDLVELELDLGFGVTFRRTFRLLGVRAPRPEHPVTRDGGIRSIRTLEGLLWEYQHSLVVRTHRGENEEYLVELRGGPLGHDLNALMIRHKAAIPWPQFVATPAAATARVFAGQEPTRAAAGGDPLQIDPIDDDDWEDDL